MIAPCCPNQGAGGANPSCLKLGLILREETRPDPFRLKFHSHAFPCVLAHLPGQGRIFEQSCERISECNGVANWHNGPSYAVDDAVDSSGSSSNHRWLPRRVCL